LSRFPLDADLGKALKSIKWDIKAYRGFVNDYKNEKNREVKRGLQKIIDAIKSDFRTEIYSNDPKVIALNKKGGELFNLLNQTKLFEEDAKQKKIRREKQTKLEAEINKLSKDIEEIKTNAIYKNAFEWRFEFPEVLNNNGDFEGFDAVIGNPPYISLSKIKQQASYFQNAGYQTYSKGSDIYCLFYERGNQILKSHGILTFITSNSWLRAIYGDLLKKFFIQNMQPISLLNIEDVQVFAEATVESNIISLQKHINNTPFLVANLSGDYLIGTSLSDYFKDNSFEYKIPGTSEWIIGNEREGLLKAKIEHNAKLLKDFDIRINFGIKTGYNAAFIIDESTKNNLINEDSNCADIIKPILRGRDLKKYYYEFDECYLINIHNGVKQKNIQRIDVEKEYPVLFNHLKNYLPNVKERYDQGDHWSNLRNCAYLEDFEKPKIIWGEISDKPKFAYEEGNYYAEATTFLMTGENLKYLLAILNSKVSEWYFNKIGTTTGMGTNRWKKYKIELLPIKVPSDEIQIQIESLVDQILVLKKSDTGNDISGIEKEVDQLVYALYGITEEERKIIEGK